MDRQNQFYEPERGTGIMGWALKQLVIWLVGGFVVYTVVVNYQSFRGGAPTPAPQSVVAHVASAPADPPVRQKLQPLGQAVPPVTNSLNLRTRPDGYAYVRASVNGAEMIMAFDTGAQFVTLTEVDAVKAGVAGSLNYSIPMGSAGNLLYGAPVMLREVRIGQLVIEDVRGMVIRHMSTNFSLLGQSFLSRLENYKMQDGVWTLTWRQ